MLKKKSRVFSLSETWNEYLSLVDKVLPDKAKVIVSNKKIFLPLVTLAVVQLVVYSGIAIYWLFF